MLNSSDILEYLDSHNVKYENLGAREFNIESFCPLNNLKDNCITWIRDVTKYSITDLENYKNLLIICNNIDNIFIPDTNFIFTDNPHSVYFSILKSFFHVMEENQISETSILKTNNIGLNVSIGDFCYIGKEVVIGDNVVIKNNVSIEGKVHIGNNTVIYSGVVIGMDGYAYYDDIDGKHTRVPHLGGVIIGKNVEIGSNTCIAKGCLGDTIIHDDVKIDNLCHIAHNVTIGKNSKVIALSMLAGSSIIGEDVWVAPCSAVMNQVTVGDNSLVGMGAVVTKNVEDNSVVAGVPAKFIRKNR